MSAVMTEDEAELMPVPRRLPLLLGLAALTCVLVGSLWLSRGNGLQPVGTLEVAGKLEHVDAAAIAKALHEQIDGGFLSVDLGVARQTVEQLPWVARARAERYWPGGLRIYVWERSAYARWGVRQMVDTEAHTYTPPSADLEGDLPLLDGPPGSERDVMDAYRRFSARLEHTPFALAGLALDARGEWSALARSGIGIRLGRNAPDQKFELLLNTVGKALADHLDQVAYVDLRYTNGFAVGWKTQSVPQPGEKHG